MARLARSVSPHLLQGAGYLAWGAVALGQGVAMFRAPEPITSRHAVGIAALVVFAIAFGFCAKQKYGAMAVRRSALGVQMAAAVAVAITQTSGLAIVLLVVTAAQAPMLFSVRGALLFIVMQSALVLAWEASITSWPRAIVLMTSYLAFQGFAFVMALLASREGEARHELAMALTELAAAQVELGETHRSAERLRIARELHDQIGHQLTALNIQLEVATNTRDDAARTALALARSLGRELIGDLRSVVSAQRDAPEFDLIPALRAFAARVPVPHVRLVVRGAPRVTRHETALALFRCAQEATTNAARHAHASHLDIVLESIPGGVQLVASDDGRGAGKLVFGNGLSGLRERLEGVGGKLTVESPKEGGFTLTAWVAEEAL